MPITPKLSAARFTIASLVSLALTLVCYFCLINFWLATQDAQIPTSFKEFLLRKTQGPRIIVDSGSNSYYAIDPLVLEEAFHMPAINLADNVGYPLSHKFHYLARYAKAGDVIVLPLEWANYVHKPFYDNYVMPVLDGSISYYYQSLPLFDRLSFVFEHVPIITFLDALTKRLNQATDPDYHRDNLQRYRERLALHHGNSLGSGLDPENLGAHDNFTLKNSCDKALFGAFTISEQFRREIRILKGASDKGARIVFTWPAAVDKEGNGCYRSERVRSHLGPYVDELRQFIHENGFLVAGEPGDSVFSSDHFHDTFYHITEPAARVRTARLAARMKEAGIAPAANGYQAGDSIKQLSGEVDRLLASQGAARH